MDLLGKIEQHMRDAASIPRAFRGEELAERPTATGADRTRRGVHLVGERGDDGLAAGGDRHPVGADAAEFFFIMGVQGPGDAGQSRVHLPNG